MQILSGECQIQRDGSNSITTYAAGTAFVVADQEGFTISCSEPVACLCGYL